MLNVTIVIPAYQPSSELIKLIGELKQQSPQVVIIVVDDGSGVNYQHVFDQVKHYNVTVLSHTHNQGKGAALKTAFTYCVEHYHDQLGVVTADADGQHTSADILRLAKELQTTPNRLHLGVRAFEGKVPLRSLLGNQLTAKILRLFTQTPLRDTQTGLRGVPRNLIQLMLGSHCNGYQFELEMLLVSQKNNIAIAQHAISTIYLNHNASSHFNPLLDSLKIYWVFVRFSMSALLSFIVDFSFFVVLHLLIGKIFLCLLIARMLSCGVNFAFNHHLVFNNQAPWLPAFIRYFCVVIINLLLSYAGISCLIYIGMSVYLSKIISDFSVFLLNFSLQRWFVFARVRPKMNEM